MRNPALHSVLEAHAKAVCFQLAAEAERGAEIPFEVVEEPGSRTPLYCYRPLTGEYARTRAEALRDLETHVPALRALAALEGLDEYLKARGHRRPPKEPRERAEMTLAEILDLVFADAPAFEWDEDRFEPAYAELETALYERSSITTVLVPVFGLELESPEVVIGGGLSLVRGDLVAHAPPEATWTRGGGADADADEPNVLAVLTVDEDTAEGSPVALARRRFRALLRALRLFEAGGFALGPLAWTRPQNGEWRPVPLEASGRPRGRTPIVAPQEDELRGFINLVGRRAPKGGELAWALTRFEYGCERVVPLEALTDHLLALRALLEPEGTGSGRLAARLAALCAAPEDRAHMTQRLAAIVATERSYITGLGRIEAGGDLAASEMCDHLRALLRDVLCGHLDRDLVRVADEILREAALSAPMT